MWSRDQLACCDWSPGQHHDGAAVGLPAHAPEVVPGGVERALGHSTVQYSTVQYSIVQYSTVQYNTVQAVVAASNLHTAVTITLDKSRDVMNGMRHDT